MMRATRAPVFKLGIERVQALANILRSRCCQNATSGSPQSRPPQ